MNESELDRLIVELRHLYEALDPVGERQAAKQGTSCARGCAHCCHLMTAITLPEGLLLADLVLARDDWREVLVRMAQAAKAVSQTTRVEYFHQQRPCVFLDGNECSVYADRPAACRYHYAASPSEQCSPGYEGPMQALNLIELEGEVWNFATHTLGDEGLTTAPIPMLVLHCVEGVAALRGHEAAGAARALIERFGIQNPMEWAMRSIAQQVDEPIDPALVEAVMATMADR